MSKLSASKNQLFTSESVCAGHPDKLCDAISDYLLDEILKTDPQGRAGIETVAGANQISLFGEIHTTAKLDYKKAVDTILTKLGYIEPKWGFSTKSPLSNFIHEQSPDIARGVGDDEGAGDQGMMFGFACRETPELMPMPITLAHALTKRIDQVREAKIVDWLRPDGKAQVTVLYENGLPKSIEKLVVAVAHNEIITDNEVASGVKEHIIEPVLTEYGFDLPHKEKITINGSGRWHIPGPDSDAGLTGRKIVVDGYGGYARVGGGAFSGKDPSKVDRSGAYAARYIAKNIVAHDLADKCEVGLAYVIGQPKPLMQTIDTFGTSKVPENQLYDFMEKLIDTSVHGIIKHLDLRRPIYSQTSAYGHFGKENLPWEKISL